VLSQLATDFSDSEQMRQPLRQLLVNTHSSVLVSQPEVSSKLLFAHMVTRVEPRQRSQPIKVTRIVPVNLVNQLKLDLDISDEEETFTSTQVIEYLNTADIGQAVVEIESKESG
jgi:hypothetical protein